MSSTQTENIIKNNPPNNEVMLYQTVSRNEMNANIGKVIKFAQKKVEIGWLLKFGETVVKRVIFSGIHEICERFSFLNE